VAFAKALYSASVLDLEIVACLRALQEIRLVPRKTANPRIECLSSKQSAQSASEKALTSNEEDLLIFNPRLVDCFKYLKIHLTAAQWTVVGACKN
jgi:hypothetical protein